MITIRIVKEEEEDPHELPVAEGFTERIMAMQQRIFQNLFAGLRCDHEAHSGFENVIAATVTEQPPFRIEKVCCRDFESKIKQAVL